MTLRVLAAMSGGVDSAVAAARAVEAGVRRHRRAPGVVVQPPVVSDGGTWLLHDRGLSGRPPGCRRDRYPVLHLGHGRRVRPRRGRRTSSPSTRPAAPPTPACAATRRSSSRRVLERALALGFDAVCTGHHVRVFGRERPAAAECRRGQGPVGTCWRCSPASSSPTPYSRWVTGTKEEVRAEAARRGLTVADKPDSHDICFIADGDTERFPGTPARQRPRAPSWTRTGGWSASTGERTRSLWASAAGST